MQTEDSADSGRELSQDFNIRRTAAHPQLPAIIAAQTVSPQNPSDARLGNVSLIFEAAESVIPPSPNRMASSATPPRHSSNQSTGSVLLSSSDIQIEVSWLALQAGGRAGERARTNVRELGESRTDSSRESGLNANRAANSSDSRAETSGEQR